MKALLLALSLALVTFSATAQQVYPIVDIALDTNSAGGLDVMIRPDGAFDEIISSIVFTIRWNAADNTTLGAPSQTIPEAIVIPISKSGPEQDDSGFRYQIFAGFGQQQMNQWNTAFVGGQEMTIMSIPVNGLSTFEIVNDAWTGDIMNNGDYFISLNGSELTTGTNPNPGPPIAGIIYSSAISTGIDADIQSAGSLSISPNPSTGLINVTVDGEKDGFIEVLNTLGQVVRTETLSGEGQLQHTMDLEDLSKGTYYVRYASANKVESLPFVLK